MKLKIQPMASMEELSFSSKAEKILCKLHQQPLISLDIGKNVKDEEERLICKKCQIVGKSLICFDEVQENLKAQCQQEQEEMIKLQKEFEFKINSLKAELNEQKKNFDTYFESSKQQLELCSEKFHFCLQKYIDPRLKEIIQSISQTNLESETLQKIAIFLSQQIILEGQIKREFKYKLSEIEEGTVQEQYEVIKKKVKLIGPLKDTQVLSPSSKHINTIQQQVEQIINNSNNKGKIEYIQLKPQNTKDQLSYKNPIKLGGHENSISALTISKDDKMIASGDWDGNIIVRWFSSLREIYQYKEKSKNPILDMIFSNDHILAAAFSVSFQITIFDLHQKMPIIRLMGHNNTVWRIQFTSNSKYLLSGSEDKTLKMWEISKNNVHFQEEYPNTIYGLSISKNDKYVSICCEGGKAYLLNGSNLFLIKSWQAHQENAFGTTFSKDGEFVLTSYKDISIWNVSLLEKENRICAPLMTLKGNSHIWNIQLLLNDQILVSNDNKIKVWHLPHQKVLCQLKIPDGQKNDNLKTLAVTSDLIGIITGGKEFYLNLFEVNL